MRNLRQQLAATGYRSVKAWLDAHPGKMFELRLSGVTAYFDRWSEEHKQGIIRFLGVDKKRELTYLNPKSSLHGAKMEVVIKYDDIEEEFSKAEEEAAAAESSFLASPTRWGKKPSPAHIIYRYLARKDEALLQNKEGANS